MDNFNAAIELFKMKALAISATEYLLVLQLIRQI